MAEAYSSLIRAQLRSQLSYRTSFLLNCLAQMLAQANDLLVIVVLFGRVASLGGFGVQEVLLVYALSGIAFGLADMVVGNVEQLPQYIRTGRFDVVLMRPMGSLAQLCASDFQLRRLGRVVTALGVLVYVLSISDIHWTPITLLLLVITPVAGAVIFGSIFIASNSLSFWLIDGRELANTVTYGGNYFTSYPVTVFSGWLRVFLAYVIGGAFVSYYPALALLGRADPLGGPDWLRFSAPVVALLAALAAGTVWRFAIRHYRGTGS
ncbi:ABC-2 family transporter protein [Kutzneria viridogrisea]|uniref:ABC transporter permease n=2 Tax=Kutzneria TaxID=43356 RepID=W5WLH5_9PSEU|nr:ABC-2 family transporter protein [Kutzneria albida]AHI01417.1 hypothetical protein KALB_8059 [Kutzneria albida DSM 43870]MBA8931377.1 ABC-2 type transport system permease protein [Kutzneria viridogrisea]